MYNQPFFIPPTYPSMMEPMIRGGVPLARGMAGLGGLRGVGASRGLVGMTGGSSALGASRGIGLFGRLGNSLSAIRSLNWGGFINNASKTLGVINQTIPLVRQTGPMVRNMKSMLKLASVFKDETDGNRNGRRNVRNNMVSSGRPNQPNRSSNQQIDNNYHNNGHFSEQKEHPFSKDTHDLDNSPTFFVES